jgi:hypothetical protein
MVALLNNPTKLPQSLEYWHNILRLSTIMLLLCLIKHHTMKIYGGVEIYTPDICNNRFTRRWSGSCSGFVIPGERL